MKIDKEKLKAILEKHDVSVAYLFGSALTGNIGPFSDVDIGVIFGKESEGDDFNRRSKIADEIADVCDAYSADVINLKRVSGPLIKYNAVFGGELIFSNDDEMRFDVERKIVDEYEDTRSLRRISYSILREELGLPSNIKI